MLSYEGIFFDKKTVDIIKKMEEHPLPISNDEMHCTFKYKPSKSEIFDELVGQEISVIITGYGCDGKNSGFEVMLPPEVTPYYINYDEDKPGRLKPPHITVAYAEGSTPAHTKDLEFINFSRPIVITGRFGYWIKENGKGFIYYDKYKESKGNKKSRYK